MPIIQPPKERHTVQDDGAQTFRFGAGVDEAEAKHILEKITARFPQYRIREGELE